jgi:putative transposase
LCARLNTSTTLSKQDYCVIKWLTKPMLNFKSFQSRGSVLASIKLIYMIRKGQFATDGASTMSFANQFCAQEGVAH